MKKRLLSTLLALCLVLGLLPETARTAEDRTDSDNIESGLATTAASATDIAYPVAGGNIYFDAATGTITDCDDTVTVAVIPDTINSVAVANIGVAAFRDCTNLTQVKIPNSVTTLGTVAFYNCTSLTNISVPVTVNDYDVLKDIFTNCNAINHVDITGSGDMGNFDQYDDSPWYIGSHAGNSVTVNIEEGITSIGDFAFYTCSNLVNVTVPSTVTNIGTYAFYGCSNLNNITIPDAVKIIGDKAFSGCSSLTDISIPNGITSIGREAFFGCSSIAADIVRCNV